MPNKLRTYQMYPSLKPITKNHLKQVVEYIIEESTVLTALSAFLVPPLQGIGDADWPQAVGGWAGL